MMKSKPAISRDLARTDVDEAIGFYLREGPGQAALGFIEASERHPKIRADHVDVWRIVDGSRDLPAWLHDDA